MSFKKALISTVAAAAVASSAFGATSIDASGKGNYLVFPKYYALASAGNWSTDLRVTNTNETHAIIAKVVIRAQEDTAELLDFPIYLSPGDVWVGKLYQDTDGVVYFESTDDSMVNIDGSLVSESNPAKQYLFNATQSPDATNNPYRDATRGYVEVYSIAKADASDVAAYNNNTFTKYNQLSKCDMFDAFASNFVDANGIDHSVKCERIDANGDTDVLGGAAYVSPYHTADNIWDFALAGNDLYGQMVVKAEDTGAERSMTLMATAFDITEASVKTGAMDNVFARGKDTKVSQVWNIGIATDGSIAKNVLASLEKTEIYVNHYTDAAAETQLHMTQPMKRFYLDQAKTGGIFWDETDAYELAKQYYLDTQTVWNPLNDDYTWVSASHSFSDLSSSSDDGKKWEVGKYTDWCYYYSTMVRDLEEGNTHTEGSGDNYSGGATTTQTRHAACKEVQSIDVLADNTKSFDEGYTTIFMYGEYKNATTGVVTPTPVLPAAMTGIKVNGVGITNIYYPAYK